MDKLESPIYLPPIDRRQEMAASFSNMKEVTTVDGTTFFSYVELPTAPAIRVKRRVFSTAPQQNLSPRPVHSLKLSPSLPNALHAQYAPHATAIATSSSSAHLDSYSSNNSLASPKDAKKKKHHLRFHFHTKSKAKISSSAAVEPPQSPSYSVIVVSYCRFIEPQRIMLCI